MYVVHLQMDNSLNWVISIIVSGQITSDALWKYGEVSLLKFDCISLFIRAVVNLIFPYKLLQLRHDSYFAG